MTFLITNTTIFKELKKIKGANMNALKIYVTDTVGIGQRCKEWTKNNLPENSIVTEVMEDCDIFFSVFYDKLLKKEFIEARKKCVNFHGGISTKYRGSGTINWAIINGEKEMGVTLHEIDAKIDHGDIIEIQRFPITENDTAQSLYEKSEKVIFEMFKKWFEKIVKLNYVATPQDHSKARMYTRKDLQDAKDLTKFSRAFTFFDKENAFYINSKGEKIYLEH